MVRLFFQFGANCKLARIMRGRLKLANWIEFLVLFVQAKRMEGDQNEIIQTGMRLLLLLTSNRNDGETEFTTSLIRW